MNQTDEKAVMSRFRAKKSYLIRKKGMSEAEALELCKPILDQIDQTKGITNEPSHAEILEEINRQKELGNFVEISASTNLHKKSMIPNPSYHSGQRIQWLEITAYMLITAGATAVLVSSALEVFGNSWEGWIKALLLEIGIISLVSMRATSFIKKVGLSTGLCFLVLLSFFVLHTGVKASQDELTIELVINDTVIKSLKAEKNRYLKNHDSLPLTHVTKRAALMAKVSELNEKIQRYTKKINTTASSVDYKAYSEVLVRAALLMLNLIFGHKLLTLIAHTNWNALRQA